MQPTRIGSFEINRISDYEGPFFAPSEFFPDFDPAVVEEHAELLGPRLLEPGTGKIRVHLQSRSSCRRLISSWC